MTGLRKPGEPARFTPPGEEEKPEAERTVYVLRTPTLYDEARLARAIKAQGARPIGRLDLLPVLKAGVGELLAGAGDAALRAEFEAAIDAHGEEIRAALKAGGEATIAALTGPGAGRIAEIANVVRRGYPAFAEAEADADFAWAVQPVEAARLLLVGWENGPAPFARGPTGLADDLLALLPPEHLEGIGWFAMALLRPSEGQAKNSDSPPPGASSETPDSAAARTPPPKAPSRAATTGT